MATISASFIPVEFYIVLETIPSITLDDIESLELIMDNAVLHPLTSDDIVFTATQDGNNFLIQISKGNNVSNFFDSSYSISLNQVFSTSSYLLKITLKDGKIGYTNYIFSTEKSGVERL